MILAAGRGERLRPLTDKTPKPLLRVGNKALIEWQIEGLVRAGVRDIVINHAWLGEQFAPALGDGARYGARIRYSPEAAPMETIGGIVMALPLLGDRPFIVTSGDVFTDFDFARLLSVAAEIESSYPRHVAHFVLADNPVFHPRGDMAVDAEGRASMNGDLYNYAGIAVYHPALFAEFQPGIKQKLFPWAFHFVNEGRVTAEKLSGTWVNVGTVDQLVNLDQQLTEPHT
jgi:N-acetyl-alpha-D-muramate 1-phosphate uridylyltransferase